MTTFRFILRALGDHIGLGGVAFPYTLNPWGSKRASA